MKKVFSNIFLLFMFPIRLIKRSKADNFIFGAIFGAIFSLIVNVATVQIQESIQKQRILEAIENEILTNKLQANSIITESNRKLQNGAKPNFYDAPLDYSSQLWDQSAEPIQYVAQLDPQVQSLIKLYYAVIIKSANSLVDRQNVLMNNRMSDCYLLDKITLEKEGECASWNRIVLNGSISTAELVNDYSSKVLKDFHPTKDRLNNMWLRLLMGDKSLRVLSGS